MPDRNFNWQTLCEAAILETNPDKLAICIGAAEHAIAQRESLVDTTELERHKLADARSMLKTLSRIASSQGKQAAYEAAQPTQQRLDQGPRHRKSNDRKKKTRATPQRNAGLRLVMTKGTATWAADYCHNRSCLRCNSRENHGSDGVPFLHVRFSFQSFSA